MKDYEFYQSESIREIDTLKEKSEFLKYEYLIALLISSTALWFCKFYFELQFINTLIAIQIILLSVFGSQALIENLRTNRLKRIKSYYYKEYLAYGSLYQNQLFKRMVKLEDELKRTDDKDIRKLLHELIEELRFGKIESRNDQFEIYRLIDRLMNILKRRNE